MKRKTKIILSTVIILILFAIISLIVFLSTENTSEYSSCNVIGIELRGEMFTYLPLDKDDNKLQGNENTITSEDVLYILGQAKGLENIKAVIIEVDSLGGSPVAAEEIDDAIKQLNKPVIAYVRESSASAAYYAISHADYIFALKNSNIGGIGVSQSYLDNVSKNQKDGLSFVQLSTGKYKDAGNPDKKLTPEERGIFIRDLEIVYNNFINTVSDGRGIDIKKVKEIADGSTVLGEKALNLKLIDQIGFYGDVLRYVEDKIGEKVDVCW